MNTSSNAPRGNQSGEMMQWEHVMNLTCFFLLMCQVLSLLKPLFGRLTGNPLLGRMTGNPICLGLQGVQQTQIPCSVPEGLSSPAIQIKSFGCKYVTFLQKFNHKNFITSKNNRDTHDNYPRSQQTERLADTKTQKL